MKQNKIPRNEYIRKPVGKTNPYKHDVLYTNLGQWKYPGQVTRIPSNDITMQGVPYPVYGEDDLGYGQIMYPGMDYTFPGQYVTEIPMAQEGIQTESKKIDPIKRYEELLKRDAEIYKKIEEAENTPIFTKIGNTITDVIKNKIKSDYDPTGLLYEDIKSAGEYIKGLVGGAKRKWESMQEEDPRSIAPVIKQDTHKVTTPKTLPSKKTAKTETKQPDISFGYKELYTVPDVNRAKDSLVAFTNTFDNDQGARYMIGHKAKEVTDAGAQKTFNNARAVAHFLRDSDILPNQKITPKEWGISKGFKFKTTSPGKTVSAVGFNDPEKFRTLYKPNPANDGTYLIKYVKNKELTPEKSKDYSKEGWELDFTVSNQHKFSDIAWDKEGTSTGYAAKSKWVPLKNGKHTYIPYKNKDGFSRFSGGSVIYLFKDPKSGKSIGVDVSGSVNTIKKAGEDIIKKYGIKPQDLELAYHDMGSYSAKPKAHGDKLDYDQWLDYNQYNRGFSGAPLIIPKQKYGGIPMAQEGIEINDPYFSKGYWKDPNTRSKNLVQTQVKKPENLIIQAPYVSEIPITKIPTHLKKNKQQFKEIPLSNNIEDTDSWLENIVEIIEPTGMLSWDDVYRAYKNTGLSDETALEVLGAIPLSGKIAKVTKPGIHLAKYTGVDKILKNTLPKNKSLSRVANASSKIGRGTDAIQMFLGAKDDSGFTWDMRHGEVPKFGGRNIFPQIELGEHGDYAYGGDPSLPNITGHYQKGGAQTPEEWEKEIRAVEHKIGDPSTWTLDSYKLLQDKLNEYKAWRENTPEGKAVIDYHNEPNEYIIPLPSHLQTVPKKPFGGQNTKTHTHMKEGGWLDEYQKKGEVRSPIYVTNPDDPRLQAYRDSLYAHNLGEEMYQDYLMHMRDKNLPINKEAMQSYTIKSHNKLGPSTLKEGLKPIESRTDIYTRKPASLMQSVFGDNRPDYYIGPEVSATLNMPANTHWKITNETYSRWKKPVQPYILKEPGKSQPVKSKVIKPSMTKDKSDRPVGVIGQTLYQKLSPDDLGVIQKPQPKKTDNVLKKKKTDVIERIVPRKPLLTNEPQELKQSVPVSLPKTLPLDYSKRQWDFNSPMGRTMRYYDAANKLLYSDVIGNGKVQRFYESDYEREKTPMNIPYSEWEKSFQKEKGGALDQYQKGGFNIYNDPNTLFVQQHSRQVLNPNFNEQEPVTGVDKNLLVRQQFKESTFNPKAVSPAKARGLAQIKKDAEADAIKAGVLKKGEDIFDPEVNARVQKWYMNDLYDSSFINKPGQKDSVKLAKALAAYNWGRGNTLKHLNEQKKKGIDIYNSYDWVNSLPKETKDYVNKILLKKDPKFEKEFEKAYEKYPYKEDGGSIGGDDFRRGGLYTPPKIKRKAKKYGTSKNIQSSINKLFTRNYDVFGPGGRNIYNPNVYKTGGWLDNVD